jgi:hypothetical protein
MQWRDTPDIIETFIIPNFTIILQSYWLYLYKKWKFLVIAITADQIVMDIMFVGTTNIQKTHIKLKSKLMSHVYVMN